MNIQTLPNDWANILAEEVNKPYYEALEQFLQAAYRKETIYPPQDHIFNALEQTSYADVKVVILGQDPYHGANQANGLAFSVQKGIKQPPSLVNIFKELSQDLGYDRPSHGDLTTWAKQGVLLLNTVLTVEEAQANSHRNQGWETFTDQIITALNHKPSPVVYILWGAQAQKKRQLIDMSKHIVIEAPHPSPLSAYRGFFGSKPFSKTNELLIENGLSPIDWEVI